MNLHTQQVAWVVGLLLALAASAASADSALLDSVPADDQIAGWLRDGETFRATSEAELTEWINGAAPFYIEHGVVEAVFQDYVNPEDVFLTLELYRLEDAAHAETLYADVSADQSEPVQDLGAESRFVGDLIGAYLIEFWQQTYFVRLTIVAKTPSAKDAILEFARVVSDALNALYRYSGRVVSLCFFQSSVCVKTSDTTDLGHL